MSAPIPLKDRTKVKFKYRNHRGEISERTVIPLGLEYMPNPGFGYQPGWFLRAHCEDRDAVRSFALANVVLPDNWKFYQLVSIREGA